MVTSGFIIVVKNDCEVVKCFCNKCCIICVLDVVLFVY